MEALVQDNQHSTDNPAIPVADLLSPVVIVGAGPVGTRIYTDIQRIDPKCQLLMFGEEPYAPYNRVKLTSFIADHRELPWVTDIEQSDNNSRIILGSRIVKIDRKSKTVFDSEHNRWSYSKLVMATGSHAFMPPIHGIGLNNVLSFRNMKDAEKLKARTISSRHTVVIGGGLLGLEAARAMRRFNTRVTVIEQSAWLMFHQLDQQTSALLKAHVQDAGIEVITNMRVQSISGNDRVESVVITGGKEIECDTVIVATGISPNTELARDAGINIRKGILVNDQLQTSDPDIYAIGECAEHDGNVYGLIQPGLEQAAVAASVITGGKARYQGSQLATQLKLLENPVYSVGEIHSEWHRDEVVYHDKTNGLIRKIFLNGNRLQAATAVGEWADVARLQEAVENKRRVWPWQIKRFRDTGSLWPETETMDVMSWPAAATVCNCMGVTRGELTRYIDHECRDARCLAERTGASTVCGSCRPLLLQIVGGAGVEAVRASRILSVGGAISLLFVMLALLPFDISYRGSVQAAWHWDVLWRDGLAKQISGFTLLGLSLLLAFLSLPKRVRKIRWGDFALWRAAHIVVGVVAAVALIAHTGMRMGHELNFMLMAVFLGLVLAGAMMSFSVGLQHRLPMAMARQVRMASLWAHIILLWPLPALLGFHILKTYWY